MKILGGQAKGRSLKKPKNNKIRPALAKVKGAIFNILGDIEGTSVLDLFAGTGNIGIEALSRGAAWVTFVDNEPQALRLIRENSQRTGTEASCQIVKAEIPWGLKKLKNDHTYSLIFVDPPYDQRLVNTTLRFLAREKTLAPGGMIIVEHSPREGVVPPEGLQITDERRYGQTNITFLKYA
ncbi:MAG: 16S rRNA (guanine(966)-N(2))-methyltransferase RsmD [Deltaproteobacteria bacterium]|nr:16S rRNA (guanine(966)-N(2))-methyltransferase RsmD [Deltaproteobacteria bacterium]